MLHQHVRDGDNYRGEKDNLNERMMIFRVGNVERFCINLVEEMKD